MFEAEIEQRKLAEPLNIVTSLVKEAVLSFTDDGLTITVVDPASVGMSETYLPVTDFDAYETTGVHLGVNLNRFSEVMGMIDGQDLVKLHLDEETYKLEFESGGLEYSMGLIDTGSIRKMDGIPDPDFEAMVECETSSIARAVKAGKMVSDHLTFSVLDGEFSVLASGDTDGVDYDMDEATLSPGASTDIKDGESMFSLDYLGELVKPISSSEVVLSLADGMPVKIDFDLKQSSGTGMFFLAPRVASS